MAQKVNLRESIRLYKALKVYNALAAFFYGAILARLFILLPLVGRKFLAGGISEIFDRTTVTLCGVEIVLSLLKLIPIEVPGILLQNWLKIFIVLVILQDNDKLLKHSSYSILVFSWSVEQFVSYLYWFMKLKRLGKGCQDLRSFKNVVSLISFPVSSTVEFIIIFLSLKKIEDKSYLKLFINFLLLSFIPVKFFLFKNMIYKYFRISSSKLE